MKQLASMSGWRAALQIHLWRHGWSVPLALAALALATAAYHGLLLPARGELVAARVELDQVALQRAANRAQTPPATEGQQLLALQAALQGPVDAAELIRRLGVLAREAQISLAQGEYQQQTHAATQLVQLQVSQPVKAAYPQLKGYIESVLRSMPNASLDQITARRENVGQAQLEVRLRWSFWIHAPAVATKTKEAP